MSKFLKKKELQLCNGGYLSDSEENPVGNSNFVFEQTQAHYIVSLAKEIKGKDFEEKPVEKIETIIDRVKMSISDNNVDFVKKPTPPKAGLKKQLEEEALQFCQFQNEVSDTETVNAFLNKNFKTVNEFEEFGLFFHEEIVKLKKIYSMKEIIEAVKITIKYL